MQLSLNIQKIGNTLKQFNEERAASPLHLNIGSLSRYREQFTNQNIYDYFNSPQKPMITSNSPSYKKTLKDFINQPEQEKPYQNLTERIREKTDIRLNNQEIQIQTKAFQKLAIRTQPETFIAQYSKLLDNENDNNLKLSSTSPDLARSLSPFSQKHPLAQSLNLTQFSPTQTQAKLKFTQLIQQEDDDLLSQSLKPAAKIEASVKALFNLQNKFKKESTEILDYKKSKLFQAQKLAEQGQLERQKQLDLEKQIELEKQLKLQQAAEFLLRKQNKPVKPVSFRFEQNTDGTINRIRMKRKPTQTIDMQIQTEEEPPLRPPKQTDEQIQAQNSMQSKNVSAHESNTKVNKSVNMSVHEKTKTVKTLQNGAEETETDPLESSVGQIQGRIRSPPIRSAENSEFQDGAVIEPTDEVQESENQSSSVQMKAKNEKSSSQGIKIPPRGVIWKGILPKGKLGEASESQQLEQINEEAADLVSEQAPKPRLMAGKPALGPKVVGIKPGIPPRTGSVPQKAAVPAKTPITPQRGPVVAQKTPITPKQPMAQAKTIASPVQRTVASPAIKTPIQKSATPIQKTLPVQPKGPVVRTPTLPNKTLPVKVPVKAAQVEEEPEVIAEEVNEAQNLQPSSLKNVETEVAETEEPEVIQEEVQNETLEQAGTVEVIEEKVEEKPKVGLKIPARPVIPGRPIPKVPPKVSK
ncbi:Hypothetical_protein [Hexamita inflata]|uniref:Hypothetical_protein n=1 Tax=Hexamita inflata TaxID=28002 RepID=A0AA86QC68_9EUKA|nr:Hypothetical protein HINF_LOCUS38032 [Hexamita inflata]